AEQGGPDEDVGSLRANVHGQEFQAPRSKLQRRSKIQGAKNRLLAIGQFGSWCLDLLWSLDLGAWTFFMSIGLSGKEADIGISKQYPRSANISRRFPLDYGSRQKIYAARPSGQ